MPINTVAFNVNKIIVISADYLKNSIDVNGTLDMEFLQGILSHELGHFESGISKVKTSYFRPTNQISNSLRLALNAMDGKNKKGFLYYLRIVFFFLFAGLNLKIFIIKK